MDKVLWEKNKARMVVRSTVGKVVMEVKGTMCVYVCICINM